MTVVSTLFGIHSLGLCPPARCTADLPTDLTSPMLVAEPKMDGSRYVLYLGFDPYGRSSPNALLSRRVSTVDGKHVDRTANCPHFTDQTYHDLDGTVLDGECFRTDFPTTSSIMGSGSAVAQVKQLTLGKIVYHAFDVMMFRGKDVRHLPLGQRRAILERVVERMANRDVICMKQWSGVDIENLFSEYVKDGGEGLIVKNVQMAYGTGWAKMKKSYDVSCWVSGFKPGNGKYTGMIGALALSVYLDDGTSIEVGFASGFDDRIRAVITKAPDAFLGKVVDVFAHELSKDGVRLRHPTFHRWRDDIEETDCTLAKLTADLKSGVKTKRWKGRE